MDSCHATHVSEYKMVNSKRQKSVLTIQRRAISYVYYYIYWSYNNQYFFLEINLLSLIYICYMKYGFVYQLFINV